MKCRVDLSKVTDPTSYETNPGYVLGGMLSAMGEQGDQDMLEAGFKFADKIFTRIDKPGILAYEGVTPASNALIAGARWNRKDDLYDTVNKGPGKAALSGPILTDCGYPEVLVARAMSLTGQDLELVLYNGAAPGPHKLKIERLQPARRYRVQGMQNAEFVADAAGTAMLTVPLNGRTEVKLTPDQ